VVVYPEDTIPDSDDDNDDTELPLNSGFYLTLHVEMASELKGEFYFEIVPVKKLEMTPAKKKQHMPKKEEINE